jgi:hypothetical protein
VQQGGSACAAGGRPRSPSRHDGRQVEQERLFQPGLAQRAESERTRGPDLPLSARRHQRTHATVRRACARCARACACTQRRACLSRGVPHQHSAGGQHVEPATTGERRRRRGPEARGARSGLERSPAPPPAPPPRHPQVLRLARCAASGNRPCPCGARSLRTASIRKPLAVPPARPAPVC